MNMPEASSIEQRNHRQLLLAVTCSLTLVAIGGPSQAQSHHSNTEGIAARCLMNGKQFPGSWKPCRVGPLKDVKDGFFIRFDGTYDAYWGNYRPAPGRQPTTGRRLMVDDQGNRYWMSGHHSFVLREVGGFHNVIEVNLP